METQAGVNKDVLEALQNIQETHKLMLDTLNRLNGGQAEFYDDPMVEANIKKIAAVLGVPNPVGKYRSKYEHKPENAPSSKGEYQKEKDELEQGGK